MRHGGNSKAAVSEAGVSSGQVQREVEREHGERR